MGMFDSLRIELDGRGLEVQTKRFDCILQQYRLGDWIGGAPAGIRVYFDILTLDATGALVYRADAESARTLTLFVVLAQGVFVEYQFRDGELTPEAIARTRLELRERWSDSARLLGFLGRDPACSAAGDCSAHASAWPRLVGRRERPALTGRRDACGFPRLDPRGGSATGRRRGSAGGCGLGAGR